MALGPKADIRHTMGNELSKKYPQGDLPADKVINYFLSKYEALDLGNVGRLAVFLARYSFFGDDVLVGSDS